MGISSPHPAAFRHGNDAPLIDERAGAARRKVAMSTQVRKGVIRSSPARTGSNGGRGRWSFASTRPTGVGALGAKEYFHFHPNVDRTECPSCPKASRHTAFQIVRFAHHYARNIR